MGYFSNGTEGQMYEETYCNHCIHSDTVGTRQMGVDPPCPIWMAHQLYAYQLCNEKDHPGKVMLDMLIPLVPHTFSDGITHDVNGECKMFVRAHPPLPFVDVEGQVT